MNFLSTKSNKRQTKDLTIDVVVNSFSGNSLESQQSSEMLRILAIKNAPINLTLDINQELVFEMDKKLHRNIRESFHQRGLLFKINGEFSIPQLKINNLVLSYKEFLLLNELGYLDKIFNQSMCDHVRIFNNSLVYSKPNDIEDSLCLYCYSMKKKKQLVTVICNWRDYTDEINNEVFSFCEKNEITINLIDNQNLFANNTPVNINKKYEAILKTGAKYVIIEDEIYPFQDFFYALEKKFSISSTRTLKCCVCGKNIEYSIGLKKCFECLISHVGNSSSITSSSASGVSENNSKGLVKVNYGGGSGNDRNTNQSTTPQKDKKNPYNFVEKLKLKKSNHNEDLFRGDEESENTPTLNLNYSFN